MLTSEPWTIFPWNAQNSPGFKIIFFKLLFSLSDKIRKDYIQERRLKVINEERRKLKTKGLGLKGLNVLTGISNILGILRAKKEVEKDFKRLGIKREPTVIETLEQQVYPKGLIKRIKGFDDDV